MKKAIFFVLTPVLVLFAASCPSPVTEENPVNHYPDLEFSIIHAYDNAEPYGPGKEANYYEVKAVQLYTGTHCEIWVDTTVLVSLADAQKIAAEFDGKIQPLMTGAFGGYNYIFKNGSGKIALFLLDIKDNYGKNGNSAYVAGYFDARDLIAVLFKGGDKQYPHGNKAAMLYIDTSPSILNSPQSYSTMAHELQHLINFVNSLEKRNQGGMVYLQDTWIDEGLASAAEYIYQGGHDTSPNGRIAHFNTDPFTTISKGNNFFVWGENSENNSDTILDEYATVYMFFQWLRLQSGGGNGIYKDIAQSDKWNYQAVTEAAAKNFDGTDKSDFED
ncbi:MAG: hypothetical protein LBP74_03920, partial [Treponema sp.]|nr:hypothetical protein [Treponema sp.]